MRQLKRQTVVAKTYAQIITWATISLFLFRLSVEKLLHSFELLSYVFGLIAVILASLLITSRFRRTQNGALLWLSRIANISELSIAIIIFTLFIAEFYNVIKVLNEVDQSTHAQDFWLPTVYTLSLLILLIAFWGLTIRWSKKKAISLSVVFIIAIAYLKWSAIYPWLLSMYEKLVSLVHYISQLIIEKSLDIIFTYLWHM